MIFILSLLQYTSCQVFAPQFIPASAAAITLEAANKAALLAAQFGPGNRSNNLLSAANEGLLPVGIDEISLVKPSGFCSTVIGKSGITPNLGKQLKKGGISCSSTPMGMIPSAANMVSSLIISPLVGQDFDASIDNEFRVEMKNAITGFFGNANTMYYLAPQLLNQGKIQGHCHVVAQKLNDDGTTVPDPRKFQFFKGIDTAAKPGSNIISAKIERGTFVVDGLYRFCTITGSNTHQPMLSPLLQRGPEDDCIRLKVINTRGGDPVQAAGIVQSARDALKKTVLVTKETGISPDVAGVAALEQIAGESINTAVAVDQNKALTKTFAQNVGDNNPSQFQQSKPDNENFPQNQDQDHENSRMEGLRSRSKTRRLRN